MYDKARADLIRIWRAVGKRNLIGSVFLTMAAVEKSAPGTMASLIARIVPGVKIEVATLIVSAAALYVTRWIDVRKPGAK
jgi:uncharacterized membrane protein YhaH (DUF805 family)